MSQSKYELSDLGLQSAQMARPQTESLRQQIRHALESPIDYPPLSQSIVSGDKVAVALQPDVPRGAQVAEEVIEYLLGLGLDPSDIVLVVPKRMDYIGPEVADLSPRSKIELHVHDPDDELSVSYLAANAAGEAVKISGKLFDADVIIPIACVDSPDHSRLYPEFSLTETIDRMRDTARTRPAESDSETRLTNEHLGLFTALNVVGAPGDSVHHIAFGTRPAADCVARELAGDVWRVDPMSDAGVVVVTIEALDQRNAWNQFARAIVHAAQLTPSDASIVILAEISRKPDAKLRDALQLQFEADDEVLYRRMKKYDALTRELIQTMRDRRVFAWLDLDEESAEEIGLGHIENQSQLTRLLDRFEQKYLVRDAGRITIASAQPTR